MSKVCSKCKVEKDESEFYNNKRTPDGLDYYCKNCRVGRNNLDEVGWDYYESTQNFVESLKTECCKCGEDRPWVIQFHHIDPKNKLFNITGRTRSKSAIWKEASKCICLCSNCHDEFHHFFGQRPANPVEALDEYLTDKRY
jgi:hypothetical protein